MSLKLTLYIQKKEKSLYDVSNEEVIDPDEVEDDVQNVSYNDEGNFPIRMRNGIMLRRRTKNKVIRFRNYCLKNDSEEYYRERLMLYVPWKKETEILGKFGSYEEAFFAKHDEVKDKIAVYEPMSSVFGISLKKNWSKKVVKMTQLLLHQPNMKMICRVMLILVLHMN